VTSKRRKKEKIEKAPIEKTKEKKIRKHDEISDLRPLYLKEQS